jgi:hypothetical protein
MNKTPSQLLRDAAADIEEALRQMNVRYKVCEGCHTRRYESVPQASAYRKFEATPTKLRDAAAALDAQISQGN